MQKTTQQWRKTLVAIAELVDRKTNLRDRVLCSVLLSGIREAELLRLKVQNVTCIDKVATLEFPVTQSYTKHLRRVYPSIVALSFVSYVDEIGLSDGDYLFPSSKTVSQSSTSFELKQTLHS